MEKMKKILIKVFMACIIIALLLVAYNKRDVLAWIISYSAFIIQFYIWTAYQLRIISTDKELWPGGEDID